MSSVESAGLTYLRTSLSSNIDGSSDMIYRRWARRLDLKADAEAVSRVCSVNPISFDTAIFSRLLERL